MKILIILIILLLTVSVFAADFADTEAKQSAIVKQNLGYKTNAAAYPDSVASKHIRMATIDVNIALWANKTQSTVYTVAYQDAYTVDSMIRPFEVYFISKDTMLALKLVNIRNFIDMYNAPEVLTGEEEYGRFPPFYDWFNNRLILYPTPTTTGDSLIVEGLGKIQNIEDSTTYPSQLLVHYRTAVIYKATYLGALSKDMPQWKVQSWKALYDEQVGIIRAAIDSKNYMETSKGE
jgi:hypothetical protein